MDNKDGGILQRLAVASLEKCLSRISTAYSGGWSVAGAAVLPGTVVDAVNRHDFKNTAAAVYISVKNPSPFTTLLFFDLKDIGHISECFLEEPFANAREIAQFEDVILLELGNIMLNALINSLLNALKRSAIPSVPVLLKGDAGGILEELGAVMDLKRASRIIDTAVSVQFGGRTCRGEVIAVLPEELAAELEPLA